MPENKDAGFSNDEIPSCTIFVDKEGRWFHHGAPIIHRELITLFYDSLHLDDRGRYLIRFKGQICRLDVEDTPYVVIRTDFVAGASPGKTDRFVLRLIDGREEDLDPETLWVEADHVLYCTIRDGAFKARFLRASYYQLAQYIQHEPSTGRYFLHLNDREYDIRQL